MTTMTTEGSDGKERVSMGNGTSVRQLHASDAAEFELLGGRSLLLVSCQRRGNGVPRIVRPDRQGLPTERSPGQANPQRPGEIRVYGETGGGVRNEAIQEAIDPNEIHIAAKRGRTWVTAIADMGDRRCGHGCPPPRCRASIAAIASLAAIEFPTGGCC